MFKTTSQKRPKATLTTPKDKQQHSSKSIKHSHRRTSARSLSTLTNRIKINPLKSQQRQLTLSNSYLTSLLTTPTRQFSSADGNNNNKDGPDAKTNPPVHVPKSTQFNKSQKKGISVILSPDISFLEAAARTSGKKFVKTTNATAKFSQKSSPGAGDSDRLGQKKGDASSPKFDQKTPHGVKNPQFGFNHRLNALHTNKTTTGHGFKGIEDKGKTKLVLNDYSDQKGDKNLLKHPSDKKRSHSSATSSPSQSTGPVKHDPNHPLAAHLSNLQSKKDKQEAIVQQLKSFKGELSQLESLISAPITDVLLHNYNTIQRLALQSKDGNARKNQNYQKSPTNIQLLENIGGAFHALNSSLTGAQGKRAVKGTILEGSAGDDQDPNLIGWSLPEVDGVSKQLSTVYSSQPKIDPKTLPLYLQQVVFTNENKLIGGQKEAQKLLGNSSGMQLLLGSNYPAGDYHGTDAHGNKIMIQKLPVDDGSGGANPLVKGGTGKGAKLIETDQQLRLGTASSSLPHQHSLLSKHSTSDHPPGHKHSKHHNQQHTSAPGTTALVIHGLHPSGAVRVQFNHETQQMTDIVSLADNLPIADAFLPPNTSMGIPTELLHAGTLGASGGITGGTGGGGLSDDTLMSVSISVKELQRQFEKTHIELHKKEYYNLINQWGQRDGEKKFWNKFPLKKSKLIPKEAEIHAKYMTLLTNQHHLIKDVVSTTGYGHIQQVESREALINNLLQQGKDLDDYDLLLLLKQSRIISNDIVDIRQLTLYERDTGDKLTGKDALAGVLTHLNDQNVEKRKKSQFLDDQCNWLNSRETIILPYNSPDGFSDAHLPTLLRASLKSIEMGFRSMAQSCTPSATAYTNMISLYGQLGLPARAATLFDEMIHESDSLPDTTTYNVMLNILAKDGKTDLCLQLFDRMRQQAIDTVGFGQGEKYKQYQHVKHAEGRKVAKLKSLISHKAKAMGIEDVDFSGLVELVKNDPHFKGTYLTGFDEKNKPSQDLVPRPDVITYTTVLKSLGRTKQKAAALKLFEQMRKTDGIQPNELTWTTMIDIVCDNNDFMAGLRLFHEMRTSGIKPSRATYSAMTTAAARGGEIALTSALLTEMMVTQANNIELYGQQQQLQQRDGCYGQFGHQQSHLLIDAPFIGNIMRASAEGGQAPFALKLHTQLLKGQITGAGSIINPRLKHNLMKKAQQHNGDEVSSDKNEKTIRNDPNSNLNKMPNAVTYNALMEVLADPASWGRTSLPPAALRIGLAVYQEALINNVFKHPYSEVQSTGIIDLRPFTRNAVLFPIHFFLNSLLGEVPVYTVDGISPSKMSNNTFNTASTTDNLDIAVQSIVQRKAPSHVVGQNPYSIVPNQTQETAIAPTSQTSPNNLTTWAKPQETIRFPCLTIPPKGVLFICNKELKPVWSATPPLTGKFQHHDHTQNQKYIPSIEYAENILRHTKPWLHFTRLHYGGTEGPGADSKKDPEKKRTANNPNSLVVAANALRLWVAEQRRELSPVDKDGSRLKRAEDSVVEDDIPLIEDTSSLSKRQQRKLNERIDKEQAAMEQQSQPEPITKFENNGNLRSKNFAGAGKKNQTMDNSDLFGTPSSLQSTTKLTKAVPSPTSKQDEADLFEKMMTTAPLQVVQTPPKRAKKTASAAKYDSLPIQNPDDGSITFKQPATTKTTKKKETTLTPKSAQDAKVAFSSLNIDGSDDDDFMPVAKPTKRGTKH